MSSYQPVVIIGAPRSGTNALRDVVTRLPSVGTWPCDEINYIWRHKNKRYPSDEFPRDLARPDVQKFIRRCFDSLARKNSLDWVVEKTCANSLRVGFVDQVLSDAKFIYIVRDGVDAVASAMKRWRGRMDIPYLARKARYVPLSDLPYYGSKFVLNRLHRAFSREKRLAFWGPILNDMEAVLKQHTIEEVCAIQWKRCVDLSESDFRQISPERVHRLRYEDFAQDPELELRKIVDFLEVDVSDSQCAEACSTVVPHSIGKGRSVLTDEVIHRISPLIESTQAQLGYGQAEVQHNEAK